jgi:hypothetical protein
MGSYWDRNSDGTIDGIVSTEKFKASEARARRWKALAKKLLRRCREERAQRIYDDLEGSDYGD